MYSYVTLVIFFFITKEVMFIFVAFLLVCFFIGWFVSRITQKLLYGFPQNLDEGWDEGQNRTFCTDPDKGSHPEMFFHFLYHCDHFFFTPSLISLGIMHGF